QEDYRDLLDEQGRDYLRRIQVNASRMAQMIDDLLDLSRATRSELRRELTDLTALAYEVIADLRIVEPQRQVQVSVADGLTGSGDPHLVRLVLQNLLGNAWKFTARQPDARIEFTAIDDGGSRTYVVRDNGAGFEMRFADKLFDAFQRLHTTTEFDGSGIGL